MAIIPTPKSEGADSVAVGWQEDGSYVPCPRCHWQPPPPDPNERHAPGTVPRRDVPGTATHFGDCPLVSLPPDVQRELQRKLDEMDRCRRRAEVESRNYFIG